MSEQNHKHRWAIILAGGDGTVGHLEAFLDIIFRTLPDLYRTLSSAREALGSVTEEQVLRRLYSEIISANFSKEVLAQRPETCPSCRSVASGGLTWVNRSE